MSHDHCFKLVARHTQRRSGTAVLIFPGLIPTYSDLDLEIKLFAQFGDVLEFHYPERNIKVSVLYQEITEMIKRLKYKKLLLVGVSFGGAVAYLLARYWRKHRANVGLKMIVALSTPFEPGDLTPKAQFQLDFGATIDRYARKLFIWVVRLLKFFWRFSFGIAYRFVKDTTLQQTVNGIRLGKILCQDWVVKDSLGNLPALLLNTKRNIPDSFVLRENEVDFKDIFPRGKIMRVLRHHADISGITPAAREQIAALVKDGLRRG